MCIASVFSEFLSPHNRESIFRCQGYNVQTKFSAHCRETNEYCYVPEKLQNIMGIVLPNMYISMDTTENIQNTRKTGMEGCTSELELLTRFRGHNYILAFVLRIWNKKCLYTTIQTKVTVFICT